MKDRTDTVFVETVFAKSISFRSGDIRSPNANNLMFVLILTNPVIQASSICKYGKFYKKHQNNMVKGDLQSIWMEICRNLDFHSTIVLVFTPTHPNRLLVAHKIDLIESLFVKLRSPGPGQVRVRGGSGGSDYVLLLGLGIQTQRKRTSAAWTIFFDARGLVTMNGPWM